MPLGNLSVVDENYILPDKNREVMKKLQFANIPTPVQTLKFNDCTFQIKRDDLTGMELSGNKVRKLEYLLYDAKRQGAGVIFTCGGDQSNHARATAIAAAAAGFKSKLFLWGKDSNNPEGNLFLDKFIGSEIQFLTRKMYENVYDIMNLEKEKREKKGQKVYIIPAGGSSEVGIWGYINFYDELKNQINLNVVDGILTACGSGGTSAGLLTGAAIHNPDLRIYAVNVLASAEEMRSEILTLAESCIRRYKLNVKFNKNNLIILDGYSAEGYKHISPDIVNVIRDFARKTSIILDPAYTGKAFCAYNDHFLKNKRKSKVLFVHTGGFFGVFNKRKQYLTSIDLDS